MCRYTEYCFSITNRSELKCKVLPFSKFFALIELKHVFVKSKRKKDQILTITITALPSQDAHELYMQILIFLKAKEASRASFNNIY